MLQVRTGGEDSGAAGVSLLVIDRKLPGITVRKMETQASAVQLSFWAPTMTATTGLI